MILGHHGTNHYGFLFNLDELLVSIPLGSILLLKVGSYYFSYPDGFLL